MFGVRAHSFNHASKKRMLGLSIDTEFEVETGRPDGFAAFERYLRAMGFSERPAERGPEDIEF